MTGTGCHQGRVNALSEPSLAPETGGGEGWWVIWQAGLWGGPSLTNAVDAGIRCVSCHGAGGAATKIEVHKEEHRSGYPAFWVSCVDCHKHDDSIWK